VNAQPLQGGESRAFVLVFDAGDEITPALLDFARREHLTGSHFTGIGALRNVVLGFWDPELRDYRRIHLDEQVEVLALTGNIATGPDGGPKLHAHIVVGKSDGTAHGGHLLEGTVRPTLEVVVVASPAHLRRRIDERTGLALLRPTGR
jgi:predicted DNA-binding protein with PD1-like motif